MSLLPRQEWEACSLPMHIAQAPAKKVRWWGSGRESWLWQRWVVHAGRNVFPPCVLQSPRKATCPQLEILVGPVAPFAEHGREEEAHAIRQRAGVFCLPEACRLLKIHLVGEKRSSFSPMERGEGRRCCCWSPLSRAFSWKCREEPSLLPCQPVGASSG